MTECPLCGENRSREVLGGSPYFRCLACGVVFNTLHVPLAYSDDYFINDYRAQYGHTYEEDFSNIYRSARNRISHIRDLWNSRHMVSVHSLLDVGSALGFFLKAAHDEGLTRLEGIEISHYAADYCRKRFGYSIIAEQCRADTQPRVVFDQYCPDLFRYGMVNITCGFIACTWRFSCRSCYIRI